MNVGELIDELRKMPRGVPVCFSYPSGDYWKRVLAPEVDEVTMGNVVYSVYHHTNELLEQEVPASKLKETTYVVVLSGL